MSTVSSSVPANKTTKISGGGSHTDTTITKTGNGTTITKTTSSTSTDTTIDTSSSTNTVIDINKKSIDDCYSPTTHINHFHKNSHDLAMVFSQVPWMRFSVVAQPDLCHLSENIVIKEFIKNITTLTISTVSREIHEEITVAVNQVIQNIAKTVDTKIQIVHEQILKEIISVTAQCSATACGNLDACHMQELRECLCVNDCNCTPDVKHPTPIPCAPGSVDYKPIGKPLGPGKPIA